MAKKVLEVKDLKISFKTDNGFVRAVRNVSFDLEEGETLCVVGESGSGKSVTSKAIMGILANNAIVENGSIIYEGENLLEVSEEEFHRIRGKKIGMIFQDPLSSLNPIVKIGKQITEATLVNSCKIKKLFQEKIVIQLVAYRNFISQNKIAYLKALAKYEEEKATAKKRLKEESLSEAESAAIKESVRASKMAYLAIKLKLKAERKEKLPALKSALKKRKKEAKAEVKVYRSTLKAEYAAKISTLKASKANAKESDIEKIDQELALVKKEYIDSLYITKAEAKRRAIEIMTEVGIPMPERRFKQYPFQFSGGMRQRIVIAIALTADPDILICDEPTTALDVTIQAQILDLINKLKRERKLSCVFITHDLGVVANMADRVAVMYAGKIVEYGSVNDIFYNPKHPYTWALLSSIPDVDSKERLEAIPGTPPDMIYPPAGDAFALRSKYAMGIDFNHEPPFFKVSDNHYAATWLLHPDAPKVEMPKIVAERIERTKGGSQQ
ncbi:MAG: ABC transporter ATP-binding protein [Erysipelotrichales bacterium]|nr:ABC transporter ATP-binding protein [Erysipelotrichales bacterium]